MSNEIWKPVKGYEGLYEVSNMGRVRSLPHIVEQTGGIHPYRGIILHPVDGKGGYPRACLYKNGRGKLIFVHRLVAQAFIPNPDGLPMVNHKDENPRNNRVKNLEWCDAKYNNNYGTRNKRLAITRGKPIKQISSSGGFMREWPSASAASRDTGIAIPAICKVANHAPIRKNGKIYYLFHAGGYKWEWA